MRYNITVFLSTNIFHITLKQQNYGRMQKTFILINYNGPSDSPLVLINEISNLMVLFLNVRIFLKYFFFQAFILLKQNMSHQKGFKSKVVSGVLSLKEKLNSFTFTFSKEIGDYHSAITKIIHKSKH